MNEMSDSFSRLAGAAMIGTEAVNDLVVLFDVCVSCKVGKCCNGCSCCTNRP